MNYQYLIERIEQLNKNLTITLQPESYYIEIQARIDELEDMLRLYAKPDELKIHINEHGYQIAKVNLVLDVVLSYDELDELEFETQEDVLIMLRHRVRNDLADIVRDALDKDNKEKPQFQ